MSDCLTGSKPDCLIGSKPDSGLGSKPDCFIESIPDCFMVSNPDCFIYTDCLIGSAPECFDIDFLIGDFGSVIGVRLPAIDLFWPLSESAFYRMGDCMGDLLLF